MNVCKKCNNENSDSAAFCGVCGEALETNNTLDGQINESQQFNQQDQQFNAQFNEPQQFNQQGQQFNSQMPPLTRTEQFSPSFSRQPQLNNFNTNPAMGTMPPAVMAIKDVVTSNLFLVAAIVYSLGAALNLVHTVMLTGVNVFNIASYLFSGAVVVFSVLGIWIAYLSFKNMNRSLTSGFTIMKAYTIVQIVLLFLVIAVLLLVMLLMNSFADDYLITIVNLICAVVCIMLVIPIVYLFVLVKCLSNVNKTIRTGAVYTGGMTFVAVCNYIAGIATILSGLGSLLTGSVTESLYGNYADVLSELDPSLTQSLFSLGGSTPLVVLASLCTGVGLILFAHVIFKYKKAVSFTNWR